MKKHHQLDTNTDCVPLARLVPRPSRMTSAGPVPTLIIPDGLGMRLAGTNKTYISQSGEIDLADSQPL